MELKELSLPDYFYQFYHSFPQLTPVQKKAAEAGLLQNQSLLVCSPTASGKTLIATIAIVNNLSAGKAIYLVPLKALASEKFQEYQKLFQKTSYHVALSTSEIDSDSPYLAKYDLIILTTEKLDSLIRHQVSWLSQVKTVIIDEVHLLNDPSRGPTLEIIITLLKSLIKPQLIALSATIGNPKELAFWLEAKLVADSWRPVKLKQGIYCNQEIEFFD